MPLKITGKILDESGLPLYQIAQISEVAAAPGQTVSGNIWSDEETGNFTFLALDPNSLIKVESIGYGTVSYKANAFPAVIKLQPLLVIEGKVTEKKKKDNTLTWVLAAIAGAALLGIAINNNNSKPQTQAKAKPVSRQLKPKTVTV